MVHPATYGHYALNCFPIAFYTTKQPLRCRVPNHNRSRLQPCRCFLPSPHFIYLNMAETTHLGKKISRIRELRGMKQETLAEQLGISQQAVSKIEQSENVEDLMLDRIAKALGVTAGTIKSFNEEVAINIFSNTYHDNSASVHYSFNPIEKVVELYDALLKSEREKIALLERLLEEKGRG
jgi:transcriptional regulator with XRE-family HTH domain